MARSAYCKQDPSCHCQSHKEDAQQHRRIETECRILHAQKIEHDVRPVVQAEYECKQRNDKPVDKGAWQGGYFCDCSVHFITVIAGQMYKLFVKRP